MRDFVCCTLTIADTTDPTDLQTACVSSSFWAVVLFYHKEGRKEKPQKKQKEKKNKWDRQENWNRDSSG